MNVDIAIKDAKAIMDLICKTCYRRDISNGCLDCRLKQWDSAAYLYATQGMTMKEAVDKTEEVINKGMKDTSDNYDAKHEVMTR